VGLRGNGWEIEDNVLKRERNREREREKGRERGGEEETSL